MVKITRATQKIFGSSAGANQIAVFGSLNAGTPTFSTAISDIQSLSNYLVGWYNAVIGGNSPAIEDMNALHYLFAYQLAYILQEGVAEWDSGTTYYSGSVVNDGTGNLYVSLQNTNLNHLVTDTSWWRITSPSSLAQYNMFVGDSNSAAQPTDTSLLGDITAKYVSQSYTVTNAAPGVFTVAVAPLTGQTAYVTVTQNGFTANVRYYVTNVSGTTFKLATSLANAIAGTNITSSGAVAGVIISGGLSVVTGSLANPMTTLGDLSYGGSTPVAGTATRLAGDTSNTRKFLRTLSSAGTATAPAWDTIAQGDLPSLTQFNVNIGDSSNAQQQSGSTALLGDVQASYISQTYAVTAAAPGVFTVAVAPATGTKCYVTVTQNGFTLNTTYYATNVSGTTFKLATTLANALAGTNITSSGTTAGVILSGGLIGVIASATARGIVDTTTQTFAGTKTFSGGNLRTAAATSGAGSAANPYMTPSDATTMGWYFLSTSVMGFAVAGASQLEFHSGGCTFNKNNQNPASIVDIYSTSNAVNTKLVVRDTGGNILFCDGNTNGANTAGSSTANVFKLWSDSGSGRSINAGGTINASGADYAEYMRKANVDDVIAKGEICGINANGLLTKKYSEAIRFVVKSTNPNFVGGDDWANDFAVPSDVVEKQRKEITSLVKANIGFDKKIDAIEKGFKKDFDRETCPVLRNDLLSENRMSISKVHHELGRAVHVEVTSRVEKLQKEIDVEVERRRPAVDRVSFCGQIPCMVTGPFEPGDWILPQKSDIDSIQAIAIADDKITFAQYKSAVGQVWKKMQDGKAWIAVGVK